MTIDLNRIKAERFANDLTQDDVAKRMGWKTRGHMQNVRMVS